MIPLHIYNFKQNEKRGMSVEYRWRLHIQIKGFIGFPGSFITSIEKSFKQILDHKCHKLRARK